MKLNVLGSRFTRTRVLRRYSERRCVTLALFPARPRGPPRSLPVSRADPVPGRSVFATCPDRGPFRLLTVHAAVLPASLSAEDRTRRRDGFPNLVPRAPDGAGETRPPLFVYGFRSTSFYYNAHDRRNRRRYYADVRSIINITVRTRRVLFV